MKLPKKESYLLSEVAKDWSCDILDILQYWHEGKIYLCIEIIPPRVGKFRSWGKDIPDSERLMDEDLIGLYYIDDFLGEKNVSGAFIKSKQFRLDSTLSLFPSYDIDQTGGFRKHIMGYFDGTTLPRCSNELANGDSVNLSIKDLRITFAERTRFENEYTIIDETSDQRVARLKKRKKELQEKGVKNFNQRIADEEGISISRVKQLISKR